MAAGAVAGFDLSRWASLAQENPPAPTILSSEHYDLVIEETPINFTGRTSVATTINGSVPGPTLRWREGDTVTIRGREPFEGADLESLAWNQNGERYGWRPGFELSRNRTR